MGKYADNLFKKAQEKHTPSDIERLEFAAIIRDGNVHIGGRSHYEVRQELGDMMPTSSNPTDIEGFVTTTGRFVTRREAQDVAVKSGQISSHQGRPLLSSDIRW